MYAVFMHRYVHTRILVHTHTQTEVKCINIHVMSTAPIFENPSPANGSTLPAYVGCPLLFTMAALKNDTAQYDLLVRVHSTAYRTFAGTLIPHPTLPEGAVFNSQVRTSSVDPCGLCCIA